MTTIDFMFLAPPPPPPQPGRWIRYWYQERHPDSLRSIFSSKIIQQIQHYKSQVNVVFNCRRVYRVVDFVFYFFNVLLGFFSCIKRILFSVAFGTILISRLDRPLLMKGFETFDTGQCVADIILSLQSRD